MPEVVAEVLGEGLADGRLELRLVGQVLGEPLAVAVEDRPGPLGVVATGQGERGRRAKRGETATSRVQSSQRGRTTTARSSSGSTSVIEARPGQSGDRAGPGRQRAEHATSMEIDRRDRYGRGVDLPSGHSHPTSRGLWYRPRRGATRVPAISSISVVTKRSTGPPTTTESRSGLDSPGERPDIIGCDTTHPPETRQDSTPSIALRLRPPLVGRVGAGRGG